MTEDQITKRIEAWGKLTAAAIVAALFGLYLWLTHQATLDFNQRIGTAIERQNERTAAAYKAIEDQTKAIERGAAALEVLVKDALRD